MCRYGMAVQDVHAGVTWRRGLLAYQCGEALGGEQLPHGVALLFALPQPARVARRLGPREQIDSQLPR